MLFFCTQILSNTGFESPCSTKEGELPLLPFGNPIGFVPASRGGVYIESTKIYFSKGNTRTAPLKRRRILKLAHHVKRVV
jgi:hypothetical protein